MAQIADKQLRLGRQKLEKGLKFVKKLRKSYTDADGPLFISERKEKLRSRKLSNKISGIMR